MCDSINYDLIDLLAKKISDEQQGEYQNIESKIDMIKSLTECLEEVFKDDNGIKISMHLNEPFKGMGFISVVGDDIAFMSPDVLAWCAALSSNVELYPLTSGKVQINFTFHGIAKKIK